MYYTWSWWWFMSWLIPMLLLAWVIFGWSARRSFYRGDSMQRRDELPDDYERTSGAGKLYRGRGPRDYVRSDGRILEDVCDRLTLDDQLDASAMEVDVDRAVVHLRGRVTSRYAKRRAEAIADSVLGVKDVDNKLEIGSLDATAAVGSAAPAHSS